MCSPTRRYDFCKMAAKEQQQHGVILDQDQFCCSICLDLLKEPVTIQCGHSYCRGCIEICWDQEEEKKKKGFYSCPQCRKSFTPRPVFYKTNMLAEVVEKLKKTDGQEAAPSAALAHAGPADVACDFCTGSRPNKASMSCLTCMASYCASHLQPHYSIPVLQRHKLVSATAPLQDKICSKHDKLMEIYCKTDRMCLCYLCTIDEHKHHNTVSAAAERGEEEKQLVASQHKVQQRAQEREGEVKELSQAVEDLKCSAQTAVQACEKIFSELISSFQRRCSEVKQRIRDQEQTAVDKAGNMLLQLKEEIAKLRRRDTELEQLSHDADHIHFIQAFQSLCSPCESVDLSVVVYPLRYFRDVSDSVSDLRIKLERILKDTWPGICSTVSSVDILLPPEPKTRDDFLLYCCPLTFDVNSAHHNLFLSNENRKVMKTSTETVYPAHSDRFTEVSQVLCREGLSRRCYWEVKWDIMGTLSVAVSYKNISRMSGSSKFGSNAQSWSLQHSLNGYCFRHNNAETKVSGHCSYKVGVYLDYQAGTLAFYDVSGTMTLLHKVKTTFTQPVYPGLGLTGQSYYYSSPSAELIKLW
ncbi:tripartite motif-containing protein 16-like isoform X1 [Myripristis murdjan]|nr:tripartite motif-containing protein 16-like isoform X1 [Myripristis murdjan]